MIDGLSFSKLPPCGAEDLDLFQHLPEKHGCLLQEPFEFETTTGDEMLFKVTNKKAVLFKYFSITLSDESWRQ